MKLGLEGQIVVSYDFFEIARIGGGEGRCRFRELRGNLRIVTRAGGYSVALRFREESVVGHNLKSRPVIAILVGIFPRLDGTLNSYQLSLAEIPADKFRRIAPSDNIQKIGLPLFRALGLVRAVHRNPEAGNRDLALGVTELRVSHQDVYKRQVRDSARIPGQPYSS